MKFYDFWNSHSQSHDCWIIFYTYTHDWVITFYEFSMKPSKKWSLHQGSCYGVKFTPHKILCQFFQSFFFIYCSLSMKLLGCATIPWWELATTIPKASPFATHIMKLSVKHLTNLMKLNRMNPFAKWNSWRNVIMLQVSFHSFFTVRKSLKKGIVMKYCE